MTRPDVVEDPATLRERLFRVIVTFVSFEVVPSTFRVAFMRMLGCDISREVKAIWAGCTFKSSKLTIKRGVFINSGFYHDGMAWLTIEDHVAIGPRVTVVTGTHEIGGTSVMRCSRVARKLPVVIEKGCWIGAGTVILPGVTIAKGCVIGAHSLVTKTTQPDGLYMGSPARRVRDLATEAVVLREVS